MSKENSKVLVRDDGITFREVDSKGVIFNMKTEKLHTVNKTGVAIWKMCDGTRTISEIIDGIASEYNVGASDVSSDVMTFIDDMERQGLLVRN